MKSKSKLFNITHQEHIFLKDLIDRMGIHSVLVYIAYTFIQSPLKDSFSIPISILLDRISKDELIKYLKNL